MNEEQRLRRDVAWNFSAFALVAAGGVALNLIVARAYDAEALGVFNQVLTFFIVLSQLAVFGIHFSALRHISAHAAEPQTLRNIVTTGVLLVIPISSVVALGAYVAASRFGPAFYSDAVVEGFQDICFALVLFALNKVIVNVLNGLRMMRAFAAAQAARPLLLAAGAILAAAHGTAAAHLPRIILWTEVAMFTALGAWLIGSNLLGRTTEGRLWARNQLSFGSKAFVGGGLSEANTRVDILIAGSVLSDREVGIYSLAAMIVEGLVQLPSVIRNTINPMLARMAALHDFAGLRALCLRAARSTYAIMFAVIALVLALYPWGVDLVIGKAEFQESWPVLIAACCGVLIASGALPLEMILLQLGLPSLHTTFKASVLAANIAFTAILINAFGLIGAGVASGLNYVFSTIVLLGCTRLAIRHLRRNATASVTS